MSSTQPAAATVKGATPASPETPIDESETHSGDLIFGEGQLVLADGVIVQKPLRPTQRGAAVRVAHGHARAG